MLIETNVCYNGSKHYFLCKKAILFVGSNVDTNEFLLHLFYGGNKILECNNLRLSFEAIKMAKRSKIFLVGGKFCLT